MYERPNRQSVRWRAHDYRASAYYFVTICTVDRASLFGSIDDHMMHLSELGTIIEHEWMRSAVLRSELAHDCFVLMPNHLHGIVALIDVGNTAGRLTPNDGRTPCAPTRPPRSLGSFIAGFKSATTRQINEVRGLPGAPLWQRGYHDHVIRNDDELGRIRYYCAENPRRWDKDRENPLFLNDG